MADFTNSTWSEADSSNTQPSPNGFPAGILPSEVGGAVRAIMGASKRAHTRSNAMVSSTGSANAYVLTYGVAPQNGYVKGEVFRFFASFTNTGPATININGLGARNVLRADGNTLAPGELVAGQVITVVYDGASFLAQNVTTKNLRENVSISKDTDAILTLEDASAPATSFRRKGILSSKNVNGGNDWLFRQTRPSDGAVEDFTLKTGTAGTIWTTGNFNPDLKANLAGAAFSGDLTTYRPSAPTTGVLYLGNQANRYIYYDGVNYTMNGANLFVNGSQVWKRDDFNPDTKATLGNQARFNGILPSNSGEGYIYSDANTNNLRLRSGANPNYKYVGLNDDGTFQIFNGGLESAGDVHAVGAVRANGRVIVGEGGNASFIEMRDTDEGTRFVHNNSGYIGFLGSDGNWKLRVDDNGGVWCSSFGDLNSRIESRGQAYRDAAISSSNDTTAAKYFNKTTGTRQDVANIPSFNASAIDIVRGGVLRARWTVDGGGTTILQNGDNGDNFFYVTNSGTVWTKQFGDLNTRIEDRAYAHATSQAGGRVAKTGDTMTGNLEIQKGDAGLALHHPGVRIWTTRSSGDGYLRISSHDGGERFAFGNGGDIWTAQFGDLNNRIEDRAYAHASGQAAARVAKTGDTMSGELTISKAYPALTLLWGGVIRAQWMVDNDGSMMFRNGDNGNVYFRVRTNGAIETSQFGDLNTRIEDRARVWAETRQGQLGFVPIEQGNGPYQNGNKIRIGWDGNALRASVDSGDHERILHRSWINPVNDIRMAFAGNLFSNWNENANNFAEPYGGAVITTLNFQNNGSNNGANIGGARWRYVQKQDTYGNWYTVGYA